MSRGNKALPLPVQTAERYERLKVKKIDMLSEKHSDSQSK